MCFAPLTSRLAFIDVLTVLFALRLQDLTISPICSVCTEHALLYCIMGDMDKTVGTIEASQADPPARCDSRIMNAALAVIGV